VLTDASTAEEGKSGVALEWRAGSLVAQSTRYKLLT